MTYGPQDLTVNLDNLDFHYRDWGGVGQSIVLLHGLASTSHIWDLVAPILSTDFRVIALDQRGHGESDKPDNGYDFASVTEDLDKFVSYMGVKQPVIVGHSWGSEVAMEYAVRNTSMPVGICLVDGGTIDISSQEGWDLETAKIEMAPPVFTGITMDRVRLQASRRFAGIVSDEQWDDIFGANFEVLPDLTIRARLSRENHIKIIEALWHHHPPDLYPNVVCPVLLMPSRQKHDTTEGSRGFLHEEAIARAEELLPTSQTVWLEDSIHDVPVQRPALVASIIAEHIRNGFFHQALGFRPMQT